LEPRTEDIVAANIRTRRTVHLFKPRPVPALHQIRQAVDLARWAPNHRLTEPWRFYLLGPSTSEALSRLNASLVEAKRGKEAAKIKLQRWLDVPGWLVVTCAVSHDPVRAREDYAACCCAVQNLQLYLWSAGIGVKWTTGDVTREPQFFELIGVDPAQEALVALLWYGYPDEIPVTERKPIENILFELP
jgi:nitroreductase